MQKDLNELAKLKRDQPIRRYMSLHSFLDIVENRRLYFSAISSFEDRLEGALTEIDKFLVFGGADMLHNLVHNGLVAALGESKEVRAAAQKRSEEFDKAFSERVIATPFGDKKPSKELSAEEILAKVRDWIDVSCWDANENESVAMWKIYGGQGAAISLHSTIGDVLNALEVPEGLSLQPRKVEYVKFQDDFSPDHLGYFARKHTAYAYENEIRFLLYDEFTNPINARKDRGRYLKIDPNLLVKSVVVSPAAPDWFLDVVTKLIKDRYALDAQVSRSSLDSL